MVRLTGLLLVAAALCAPYGVAQEQRATLRIPRVSRPPKVQDFLSGASREAEGRVTDFRQYSPGDGVPASLQTSAFLAYDDRNLYVAFVCKDEPGKVRARVAKREATSGDDTVVVYLDTFRRESHHYCTVRRGFQFHRQYLGGHFAGG